MLLQFHTLPPKYVLFLKVSKVTFANVGFSVMWLSLSLFFLSYIEI